MQPFDYATIPMREPAPGFHARYVHGEGLTLGRVDMDAGAEVPDHAHLHEQVTTILAGTLEVNVAGTVYRLGPGQGIVIGPNQRHNARAVTACQVVDVFTPVREDYR